MKKILVCVLVGVISLGGFVACTGSGSSDTGSKQEVTKTINIKDEFAKLDSEYPVRMAGDVTEQELKDVFGINTDDIEEFTAKQCMMTPGIDVMGVFKAKEGKVDAVKADLGKIMDVKKNSAYLPGEMEALENAQIVANGDYVGVFLLQSEEEGDSLAEKAAESFNNLFK